MNTPHVKYLLVGGGAAASAAAEAIRQRDPQGSMLLVSQEVNRPYHRPALHREYLSRQRSRADLSYFPVGWLPENHVDLRTGRRVACLDTSRASATLDNGEEVSYDKLLLAVGATPKTLTIPGGDLPNVFYLRTVEDADRLHNAVEQALEEGRRHARGVGRGKAAVIGAGLLGVELAATLNEMGLHVDLIVGHAHPWHHIAGDATGAFVARHLEKSGIAVHTGHRAERLEGDGRVQKVVLSSGEIIECDLAVGAVGVRPNRDILRNTPIAAEVAILVDPHCQTSVPNIYAAGDCAAVLDPLFGKHRIIDHWENAKITGSIAGANMAGGDESYDAVSHYTSEFLGLHASFWGERRQVHHRLVRGAPSLNGTGPASSSAETPRFVEFGIAADGRVAQVIKIGTGGDEGDKLMRFVGERVQVNEREEKLKDPTQPLDAFLA